MLDMKVLDLFSGIGGFSIGLEAASMETVAFVEQAAYPAKVLRKHWPIAVVFDDVSELVVKRYDLSTTLTDYDDSFTCLDTHIDVVCGGFPCQDISVSGKQAGLEGKRSGLWFEFKRIIDEVKPKYAIIENVANLRSNGLSTVLKDLWEIGYDAQWHIIPAQAVGAEHERERIWIIAYPYSAQCKGRSLSSRIQKELSNLGNIRWGKDKPGVERTLNGVPSQMDRLKCLGNAVVPQIPEAIGRAIMGYEEDVNL